VAIFFVMVYFRHMKTSHIYIVLIVVVLGGLVALKATTDGKSTRVITTAYDEFAQCLSDAGAIFYGAYWCPHCQSQKAAFDNSRALPYIECSTPNGQGQTPVCIEQKIDGYPTWEFADGSRLSGEQTLETLAENTGCELPNV